MIDSNLAVLLAERNLKITKVSRDTGISRTTLTALCYDHSGGIKFDTLNTLCKYLDITPAEFFSYSPFDYEIQFLGETELEDTVYKLHERDAYEYTFIINIKRDNLTWAFPVHGIVGDIHGGVPFDDVSIMLVPFYFDDSKEATAQDLAAVREFNKMKKEMTTRQLNDLNKAIFDKVDELFIRDYASDNNLDPGLVILNEDTIKFRGGLKL